MVHVYKLIILLLISSGLHAQVVQERNARGADRIIILKDGFRVPIRDTATAPALLNYSGDSSRGGVVYDSTLQKLCFWTGVRWVCLDDSATGGSIDTTSLSNRINLKLNISDTTTMNANFLVGIGAGTNVTVDNTNPRFPVVSASGGGSGVPIDSVYLRWNSTASSVYSANGGVGGNIANRFNIGIGRLTLNSNLGGGGNIAIGDSALSQNVSSVDNVAIGYRSQSRAAGNFNTSIGALTLQNTTGNQITAIGYGVAQNGAATGATLIGFNAGGNNIGVRGTAVGNNAAAVATAADIAAIGNQALQANTTGAANTALGSSAGDVTTTGGENVYIGVTARGAAASQRNVVVGRSAGSSSLGSDNVAIGHNALLSNTNGSNIAVGWFAGRRSTGARLTLVGFSIAGQNFQPILSGADNGFFGHRTGTFASTGTHNSLFGATDVGYGLSTGSSNTFLGSEASNTQGAGSGTITGSNNILIGRRATLPSATASNQIVLATGGASPVSRLTLFDTGGWLFNTTSATVTTQTANALLEVNGTTGAVLLPRLTTAQRDALTATNGMILYNTTTDKIQAYAAGAWVDLH
jgi:hypothetical protein